MRINCDRCNTNYLLTQSKIVILRNSGLACNNCNKLFKLEVCPHCKKRYLLTFSTPNVKEYKVKCKSCSKEIIIKLPAISNPHKAGEEQIEDKSLNIAKKPIKKETLNKVETRKDEQSDKNIKLTTDKKSEIKGTTLNNFDIKELFAICSGAFSKSKLIASASGILIFLILLLVYNSLINVFFISKDAASYTFLRSLLNIFPMAIFFFVYLMTATLISSITMNEIYNNASLNLIESIKFLFKSLLPVFMGNLILLLIVDILMISFGNIPVVGHIIFAVLFIPMYAVSAFIALIIIVSFWFYPSIVARDVPVKINPMKHLLSFIKEHNFSLVYIIPIMMMITVFAFSAIYFLHYCSFNIILVLSKVILGENLAKLFSTIPPVFLSISNLSFFGVDSSILKSFVDNVLLTQSIAGFIIGLILIIILIFLYSFLLSIIGSVSTHFYLMLERDIDIDIKYIIKLLLLLILLSIGMLLIKKLI